MSLTRFSVLRLALVSSLLFSGACTDEQLDDLGFNVYFVKLEKDPGEVVGFTQELANDLGFQPIHVYDAATRGFSVRLPQELADDVEALPEVKYVQMDEKVKRTPDEEEPDSDDDIVEDPEPILGPDEIPESILRIGGPYLGPVDLSDMHIAVIDTGIDAGHPDLNVVGEIDVVAETGGKAAPGYDPNGHGTHCAGTIAAIADGSGVVGVAPGAPLHAVRVLDAAGSGYWTDIVAGLEYVLDHPEIRVVSMSLGGPAFRGEDPMRDAIEALEKAGVVVVIAAGNETDDTADYAPAGYDLGITVSAYDAAGGSDNGFASFSNYGDAVDIAAPGVSILSTWPDGQYAELDGTSMATPAVAGAVAVYRAVHPNKTPIQVRDAVVNTGEEGYKGQKNEHKEPLIDLVALAE